MFERFTKDAIKTIMLAQEESRRLGHNFVGTEQILLGLIHDSKSIAGSVLKAHGVNLRDARVEVEKIIRRGSGKVAVEIPFTPRAKRVLELAWIAAKNLDHKYIGTEHLLLGLIGEGDGVACRVLKNLGVNLPALRQAVLDHKDINKGGPASGRYAKVDRSEILIDDEDQERCPNCLEEIQRDAILCRFCKTGLSTAHFEKCPYCLEMIRKGAKLCRYCKSDLPAPLTD